MRRTKQHKKKNNQPRKSRRQNDGISSAPNSLMTLPKRVPAIMPDRFYTRLRYDFPGNLVISTILTSSMYRFRPTSAYDIDPVLGTLSAPGFPELATLYGSYRVTASKIAVRYCNTSALQGAICGVIPLLIDPGASPSAGDVTAWLSNPYCKFKMIGTAGSPPASVSSQISTEKIFGSKMVYFDDNWAAATTTTTGNNWYWAIFALVVAPPTTTQTINVMFAIELDIEFFGRKILPN